MGLASLPQSLERTLLFPINRRSVSSRNTSNCGGMPPSPTTENGSDLSGVRQGGSTRVSPQIVAHHHGSSQTSERATMFPLKDLTPSISTSSTPTPPAHVQSRPAPRLRHRQHTHSRRPARRLGHRQHTLSLAQHHDTDTASTRSVSPSISTPTPPANAQSRTAPGMFNVPQGWHCDSDATRHRSVSVGQLSAITVVVSGKASHDPHAVGTNDEGATPFAPRQIGVQLVAKRALREPSQRKDVQRAETSVAPVRKRLLLTRVLVPKITLRSCRPRRERPWNCEHLTWVPLWLCHRRGFVT